MRGVDAVLREVAAGLWTWSVEHPDWRPGIDWPPVVTSTCVESHGEVAVLDPIAPPDGSSEAWERLDARPPTLAVVLKPDHVRDIDLFVQRYGARPFGPHLFWRDDIPETILNRSGRAASCPAASSPSTTDAERTRRRSGSPSSVRSSLRTR
jgi:hypothetical protein